MMLLSLRCQPSSQFYFYSLFLSSMSLYLFHAISINFWVVLYIGLYFTHLVTLFQPTNLYENNQVRTTDCERLDDRLSQPVIVDVRSWTGLLNSMLFQEAVMQFLCRSHLNRKYVSQKLWHDNLIWKIWKQWPVNCKERRKQRPDNSTSNALICNWKISPTNGIPKLNEIIKINHN